MGHEQPCRWIFISTGCMRTSWSPNINRTKRSECCSTLNVCDVSLRWMTSWHFFCNTKLYLHVILIILYIVLDLDSYDNSIFFLRVHVCSLSTVGFECFFGSIKKTFHSFPAPIVFTFYWKKKPNKKNSCFSFCELWVGHMSSRKTRHLDNSISSNTPKCCCCVFFLIRDSSVQIFF